MTPSDIPHFAALMATLGEIYHTPITEHFSEICWESWKCYDWEDVKRSVMQYILQSEKCGFLPKPGDILRYLIDAPEIRALKAWTKTCAALAAVGSYDSVAFDDLLIHTVIKSMGGWKRLCHSKIHESSFLAHEFQKRYRGYLDRPPQYCPAYLCGSIENERRQRGFSLPPLVQINGCETNIIALSYQNQPQREQTQILLTQTQEKYDFQLKLFQAIDHTDPLYIEEKIDGKY